MLSTPQSCATDDLLYNAVNVGGRSFQNCRALSQLHRCDFLGQCDSDNCNLCNNSVLYEFLWTRSIPYKDHIEKILIVMVCNGMYSQHITLPTFSLISPF